METSMHAKTSLKPDPVEREIEQALHPGVFISYGKCSSFVRGLERISSRISSLTKTDPIRAVALDETFLAGCYEKAGELDDSGGDFGQFVIGLHCRWIEARQAAGADPEETASRIRQWMDSDPYGFCSRLERDAAKVLDKVNLAAFAKQTRAQFDETAKGMPSPPGAVPDRMQHLHRRSAEMLRTLYLAQSDIGAYIALTDETGLTAKDCHAVATLLADSGNPQEALAWAERGLGMARSAPDGSMYAGEFSELKRTLLVRLGRGNEALEDAWNEYSRRPGKYTYGDLMRFVPEDGKARWHEKAMKASEKADLGSRMGLLAEVKERKRLADLVEQSEDSALEGLSHSLTEPAAKTLQKSRPDIAARLWRAQGMRILNGGKSRYYDAALSNFESAKKCYERAGLEVEWEKTLHRVRAEHRRKHGFMPGFERLAAGTGPGDEPSFLERAKARWGGSQGGCA